MTFPFMNVLIHIGRPDLSLPHKDLSVVTKFVKENRDTALVILVDSDDEQKIIEEKVRKEMRWPEFHPGGLIISWKDDAEMMDLLCQELSMPVKWRVVGIGWYECKNCNFQLSPTLVEPVPNCTKCEKPWEFIKQNEARVKQFKGILEKAQQLVHFDTRSGLILDQGVNPTSNVMLNMPYALGTKEHPALKMKDFKDSGKGKAAICVAAGPSLDDEIENLKRLSGQVTIISVGRVYKRLRDAGVKVDYAYSCEMFAWDSAIFDNIGDVGDTILCYPPVCSPATVQKWPGKRLCTWDINSAHLIGETLAMMGGNSVAHHMLNFAAEILGAEPIILVGQDLAYPKANGQSHASNSAPETWPDEVKAIDSAAHGELTWAPCTGKSGRFDQEMHRSAVALEQGSFTPVGDIEVRTSKAYVHFGALFDILISRHKKKVLNACGEGLKIAGTEYVDLSKWSP